MDESSTLMRKLGLHADSTPDAQTAVMHWAVTHDVRLAVEMASDANACQQVLDVARRSTNRHVRAAWLQRSDRTSDELKSAFERRLSADELIAIASSPRADDEVLCMVAARRLNAVALALLDRYSLPEPAVVDLCFTFDKMLRRAPVKVQEKATLFVRTNLNICGRLAQDLTDVRLLANLADSPTLNARGQWQVFNKVVNLTDFERAGYVAQQASLQTGFELMTRLALDRGLGMALVDFFNALPAYRVTSDLRAAIDALVLRVHNADTMDLADRFAAAATTDDVTLITDLFAMTPPGRPRRELAASLLTNPTTPAEMLLSLAGVAPRVTLRDVLATRRTSGHSDDNLTHLAAQLCVRNKAWLAELAQAAPDPDTACRMAVSALTHADQWSSPYTRLRESRVLTPDNVDAIVTASVARATDSLVLGWIGDMCTQRLGHSCAAWSLFESLASQMSTEPLGVVLDTTVAALA